MIDTVMKWAMHVGGEFAYVMNYHTQPKSITCLFALIHWLYCIDLYSVQVLAHMQTHDFANLERLNPGGQV